jgi:hypothetical protein
MTAPETGVAPDVAQFIAEHLHSLYQLEVLLLLAQTAPEAWNAARVAAELRTNTAHAVSVLEDLAGRGLLAGKDGDQPMYWYQPATSELAQVVTELDKTYAQRRLAVINLIFSKPPEKLEAMRAFADAFRIRGKRP